MLPELKTRRGLDTWPVLTGSARFKGVKTPRGTRSPQAPVDSEASDSKADENGTESPPAPTDATASSTESIAAQAAGLDVPHVDGDNGGRCAGSTAEDGSQNNGAQGEGGVVEATPAEGLVDASKVDGTKGGREEEGEPGMEMEGDGEFPWPAVASDAPLQDAVNAGLRHHPSFADRDEGTARK